MMKAIQNKTGVTTTHQPAYEGDIFTNILLQNYKQQQDSPNSSLTFEDLATQWYKDFLVQGHTATDNTGFENGIFAAYGDLKMSPSFCSAPTPHKLQYLDGRKTNQLCVDWIHNNKQTMCVIKTGKTCEVKSKTENLFYLYLFVF